MNKKDVCFVDYPTIHIVNPLRLNILLQFDINKANVSTVSSKTNLIKEFERANIMLLNGSRLHINDVLNYSKFIRYLLSIKISI